jgi:hypothetical protein
MSSYGFLRDEAQGANRVSGRQNRRRLEGSGEADYGNDRRASFDSNEGDFLREPAESAPNEDANQWQVTGLDRVLNVEQDEQGEDQFNANWMNNEFKAKVATSPPGYERGRDDQPFERDAGDDIPMVSQMLDAENGRPIGGTAPQAAPAGPKPKKRGFFKKLWSKIRGRGWR